MTPHLLLLAARAHSHALFVLSKFLYIFDAKVTHCQLAVCPADRSLYIWCIWDMNHWFVALTSSLCGDKRGKIAPIGAHWSLFQKQQEGLFMHTYHWKQTKETKTAAVILQGGFKQRKGTLQQKEEQNKNIRPEGAGRFWFSPELSPLKRRFFFICLACRRASVLR